MISRWLKGIFTVLLVTSLSFAVLDFVPGSFLELRRLNYGESSGGQRAYAQFEKEFNEKFHIDWPLWRRLGFFFNGVINGESSPSYQNLETPIYTQIAAKIPVTFSVAFGGVLVSMVFGIPLGVLAARWKNTWPDYFIMGISLSGLALPPYLIAVGLILLFSVVLSRLGFYSLVLPAGGWGEFKHLILPSLALGWGTMSIISKYVRSSIIETLDQDFIRTAYAKGLSKWRVLFVHALKPSLIPLISIIGSQIATLIVGSVLVEEVFRLQGLGSEFIKAAMYRDTPLLAYITLILSGTVVFFNVFADSLYRWVDPRIGKDL